MSEVGDSSSALLEDHDFSDAESIIRKTSHAAFLRHGIFQFLRLPPEIRNQIYRLIVVGSKPLSIYCREPCPRDEDVEACNCSYDGYVITHPGNQHKKDLEIFMVSSQVWVEASDFFYSENVFVFDLDVAGPIRNGFHSNIKRVRKCLLFTQSPEITEDCYLDWTYGGLSNKTVELVTAFANALIAKNKLEFLLISAPCREEAFLQPLECLRGIKRVQINKDWHSEMVAGTMHVCKRSSNWYKRCLRTLLMSSEEYSGIGDISRQDIRDSKKALALKNLKDGGKEDKKLETMKEVCWFVES